MKCNAKVIYYEKKNKNGSKKVAFTLKPDITTEELDWVLLQNNRKKLDVCADNGLMYECQGKIIMTVTAENEPYMGGSSAQLEVNYRCDTCKHTYYPELPTNYSLNEWLNNILEKME